MGRDWTRLAGDCFCFEIARMQLPPLSKRRFGEYGINCIVDIIYWLISIFMRQGKRCVCRVSRSSVLVSFPLCTGTRTTSDQGTTLGASVLWWTFSPPFLSESKSPWYSSTKLEATSKCNGMDVTALLAWDAVPLLPLQTEVHWVFTSCTKRTSLCGRMRAGGNKCSRTKTAARVSTNWGNASCCVSVAPTSSVALIAEGNYTGSAQPEPPTRVPLQTPVVHTCASSIFWARTSVASAVSSSAQMWYSATTLPNSFDFRRPEQRNFYVRDKGLEPWHPTWSWTWVTECRESWTPWEQARPWGKKLASPDHLQKEVDKSSDNFSLMWHNWCRLRQRVSHSDCNKMCGNEIVHLCCCFLFFFWGGGGCRIAHYVSR